MLKCRNVFVGILLVCFSVIALGQNVIEKTRMLFVLDASQSMSGYWESARKIDIATHMLIKMVDSLSKIDNVELALRMYGHQSYVPPQDCNDTKLEVPFMKNNAKRIISKLKQVHPKGTTPIAYALEQSSHDFPDQKARNIIILITDGVEACDGDPCAVSRALQKKGIVLKPFVVGVGLDPDFKATFNCVGKFYDASDEEKFKDVMGVVISQALNNTTAQINLLDAFGNPTETSVGMSFYDEFSGKNRYNYMHTINNYGLPDTIILDPLSNYKMVVHTMPPIIKDSISISPGKHNVIGVDAPRGTLILKQPRGAMHRDLQFIVLDTVGDIVNVQTIEQSQRYITGLYKLEILTLPRITIDSVKISQSHTTKIRIPQPGIVNFSFGHEGICSIYLLQNGNVSLVKNVNTETQFMTLTLQPGSYMAIYRSNTSHSTLDEVKKRFKINSGTSIRVMFY